MFRNVYERNNFNQFSKFLKLTNLLCGMSRNIDYNYIYIYVFICCCLEMMTCRLGSRRLSGSRGSLQGGASAASELDLSSRSRRAHKAR